MTVRFRTSGKTAEWRLVGRLLDPRTSAPTLWADDRNGQAPRTTGPNRISAYVNGRLLATGWTPLFWRRLLVEEKGSLTGRVGIADGRSLICECASTSNISPTSR
jgi:hypothetical protein